MHEITANEILRVFEHALHSPESVQLETKRVSGKMVGKALETICAFANTKGGWRVLGMDDFSRSQGND